MVQTIDGNVGAQRKVGVIASLSTVCYIGRTRKRFFNSQTAFVNILDVDFLSLLYPKVLDGGSQYIPLVSTKSSTSLGRMLTTLRFTRDSRQGFRVFGT